MDLTSLGVGVAFFSGCAHPLKTISAATTNRIASFFMFTT